MWEFLDKPIALLLLVALPLAWGLTVEYVFELRRRRLKRKEREKSPDAGDIDTL
jgi:hypothetical protein